MPWDCFYRGTFNRTPRQLWRETISDRCDSVRWKRTIVNLLYLSLSQWKETCDWTYWDYRRRNWNSSWSDCRYRSRSLTRAINRVGVIDILPAPSYSNRWTRSILFLAQEEVKGSWDLQTLTRVVHPNENQSIDQRRDPSTVLAAYQITRLDRSVYRQNQRSWCNLDATCKRARRRGNNLITRLWLELEIDQLEWANLQD